MNNIYLIYGDEDYFINNEINKLRDKYKSYDLINYDMFITNISDVIEDASMISLFSSNKLIICSNCTFLTGSKCEIEHNVDELMKYINNSKNFDTILVLTVKSETLDNRKKIVKELNKCNVFKCNKLKNYELDNFIKDYCKSNGYSIDFDALSLFKEKLDDNLYIITSELDKLFLYKNDNKIIKSDVEIVTSRMIKTDIFDLINAIVEDRVDDALALYDDLLLINEEEIKLIITLANQFRLIYQVKNMYKMGFSESDITSKLGVHPYRIKLANNVNISLDKCIYYLKKLSVLDENIKLGKIDKKIGFQKFILSL